MVRAWIADGTLPAWTADALECRPETFQVTETAYAERNMGITTYHSPSFALGVSTVETAGQSDVWMVHYAPAGRRPPGRGLHPLPAQRQVAGRFLSRHRPHQIAQPDRRRPAFTACRAAHARSACTRRANGRDIQRQGGHHLDRARPGGRDLGRRAAHRGLAGRGRAGRSRRRGQRRRAGRDLPLSRTDLGRDAPIRLVERGGDLVLELYNYLGPKKAFWEMRWPGAFFKGGHSAVSTSK